MSPVTNMDNSQEPLDFFGTSACRVLLRAALVGSAFLAVVAYFLDSPVLLTAGTIISINLALLLWLLRRGQLLVAQIGVVIAFWMTAAYLILMAHGVRDTAVLLYPPIFLFSGITLNRIFFWIVSALSMCFLLAVGLAEQTGYFRTRYSDLPLDTDLYLIVVILAVVAIFTDLFITAARRHILAMSQAKQAIEKADRTKTEFLNMMSHEMRSPLNPIVGYSDLLREDLKDPEHQAFVSEILESSNHMISMIDSMLEYSRIADGTVPLQSVETRVAEICEELETYASASANAKGLKFGAESTNCAPEYHVLLLDRQRLIQILKHLIANAIRVTDSGQVSLALNVEPAKRNGASLCCVVSDNGPKVDDADLKELFEPFTQEDQRVRKRGEVGLGLELAKCRQLARLLGGDIHCEPNESHGARFVLKVPVRSSAT